MDPQIIRSVITDQLSAAPGAVLGCALGTSLRSLFPTINFRLEYGGLRRFVEYHCSDTVEVADSRSGDNLYSLKNRDYALRPSMPDFAKQSEPTPTRRANFWKIFSNPAFQGRLLYHRSTETLQHALESGSDSPDAVEVRRMSYEEQRAIARDFATNEMMPEHAGLGLAILDQPNYWPAWTRFLHETNGRQYFYRWTAFRNERVRAVFIHRLKEHGIEQEAAQRCVYKLSEYPKLHDTSSAMSAVERVPAPKDEPSLRELAQLILARLPDDELRKLMLPLGLLYDVQQDHRRGITQYKLS